VAGPPPPPATGHTDAPSAAVKRAPQRPCPTPSAGPRTPVGSAAVTNLSSLLRHTPHGGDARPGVTRGAGRPHRLGQLSLGGHRTTEGLRDPAQRLPVPPRRLFLMGEALRDLRGDARG